MVKRLSVSGRLPCSPVADNRPPQFIPTKLASLLPAPYSEMHPFLVSTSIVIHCDCGRDSLEPLVLLAVRRGLETKFWPLHVRPCTPQAVAKTRLQLYGAHLKHHLLLDCRWTETQVVCAFRATKVMMQRPALNFPAFGEFA